MVPAVRSLCILTLAAIPLSLGNALPAMAAAGLPTSRLTQRTPLDQGNAALRRKQWSVARKHLEKALRQDPSSLEALAGVAHACLGAGDYDCATERAQQLLDASDRPELELAANIALGSAFFYRANDELEVDEATKRLWLERAERAFQSALELSPSQVGLHVSLAEVLLRLDRIDDARANVDAFFRAAGEGTATEVPGAAVARSLHCILGPELEVKVDAANNDAGIAADESLAASLVAPVKTKAVPPQYPLDARMARVEGTVVFEVVIDETGKVLCMHVLHGAPLGLTEAARSALGQWEFEPARLDGVAVAVRYQLTARFELSP